MPNRPSSPVADRVHLSNADRVHPSKSCAHLPEPVVDACPNDAGREPVGCRNYAAAACTAIDVAEIDIEVLELRGPVGEEAVFNADAYRPAHSRGVDQAERRHASIEIPECRAAGHVGQHLIEGVADPATRGAEPVVAAP